MTTPEELDRDPMYDQAVGLLVMTGKASTSFLQRRLKLGYNAAARLMERAQAEGIVSRPNDVGKRDVLISVARVAELEAENKKLALTEVIQVWTAGEPPSHIREEWFIAQTIHGERVVLRSLPEGWSYDYTTADHTYMAAENIVAWMQMPDSEYISHVEGGEVAAEAVARAEAAEAELARLRQGVQVKRVRHVKRGSTYREVGRGQIQTGRLLSDYADVVIYQSEEDATFWVRPTEEFDDITRFEKIAALVSPGDGWLADLNSKIRADIEALAAERGVTPEKLQATAAKLLAELRAAPPASEGGA